MRLVAVLHQAVVGWRERRCESARVPRPALWKRSSMMTAVMTPRAQSGQIR